MESWMPLFVAVTAFAVILQSILLLALYLHFRRTAAHVERITADINAQVTPILARVQTLVEDVSPRISGIVADASELTHLTRNQAQKVDRILTETLERMRLQLIHIDQIMTGTMEAVEEAGSRIRKTVWGPVVKATALVRGIQTGLEFFRAVRQGRQPAEPPSEHQDEGMFI